MKKISLLLLNLLAYVNISYADSFFGSDLVIDKPGNTFGSGGGVIMNSISSTYLERILGTAWIFAVAMIITVMATGVFSHHENIMKSALKVLVTLGGIGILIYWGTNYK